MAKNVLPKHWNGSEFEELHIVTKASNVFTNDNKSVQQKIDDFTSHLADIKKLAAVVSPTGLDDTSALQTLIDMKVPIYLKPGEKYYASNLKYIDGTYIFTADENPAELIHLPGSTEPLISPKNNSRGDITIKNLIINGNKENISNRLTAVEIKCNRAMLINCHFINTITQAFTIDSTRLTVIRDCTFEDMAEHSGIAGGFSRAGYIIGSSNVIIDSCEIVAEPPSLEGRAPGGFFIAGVSPIVTIVNNTFRGIGQSAQNNFNGNIDLYANVHQAIIIGNRFYDYEYTPLKLQNSGEVIVDNNIIDTARYQNGNQALVYQPDARNTQPTQQKLFVSNLICKNTPRNVPAITIQANLNPTDKIKLSQLILENAAGGGIVVDGVKDINITDVTITEMISSAFGIVLQNVEGVVALDKINIDSSGASGIYSRTNVTDMILSLTNSVVGGLNYSLTTRNFGKLKCINNIFNNILDIQNGNSAYLVANELTGNKNIVNVVTIKENVNSWENN